MSHSITVEVPPGRTIYLYGPSFVIRDALRLAHSPQQYNPRRRAIAAPRSFLDDILAALELQMGAEVKLERVVT